MYQYPGPQQQQMYNNQSGQYHSYRRNAFIALVAFFALCALCMVISMSVSSANSIGGVAVMGLMIEAICVMVIDKRGALTLRGAVQEQALHQGKMVSTAPGYVILYIIFPYIMLPSYLIRVFMESHKEKQGQELQRKREVAALEAQLGILPPTEGQCRVCHKPLVVGAEFCQYCGTPAIQRPKICPVCATTALPDAKFCPKCRATLP